MPDQALTTGGGAGVSRGVMLVSVFGELSVEEMLAFVLNVARRAAALAAAFLWVGQPL